MATATGSSGRTDRRRRSTRGAGAVTVAALALTAAGAVLGLAATGVLGTRATHPVPARVPPRVPAAAAPGAGWTLTGIGDSVTAGSGCDCDDFVQDYAALTRDRTGRSVTEHNLGVPGQTSLDLVDLLRDPQTAQRLAGSDIVLVTTGANDLGDELGDWQDGRCDLACFRRAMPGLTANIRDVVGEIRRLRAGRPTEILVTDYWNVFRDGQVGAALGVDYQSLSDQVTRLANQAICAGATGSGAACVDLYAPFKADGSADPTGLLADDGDHPDAAGHQVIASALAAHGWRELGGPAG